MLIIDKLKGVEWENCVVKVCKQSTKYEIILFIYTKI